jgi:tetratricopeptide (TPR) repeat protein
MTPTKHYGWWLLALCALAGALRLLILREYLLENPFAEFPYSDGELYWNRAGEMAAGRWLGDTPFLIGPLYPYLLGALRWLGGGLETLYLLQLGLHVATAALLAAAARVRWGDTVALAAAGLFLLLGEPALFATRVLSVTLQMALVALLWWDWARLAEAPEPETLQVVRVGAWLGLLCLAFPAALLLIPVYALWLGRGAAPPRARLARVAAGAGAAALLVSPATLHNAIVAGELIPVSAHAGVTLAQGNGPRSVGIYTPLADVSSSIHAQHGDAAQAYEAAHGRPGGWSEIDAWYRGRVIAWWTSHPIDAVSLVARKLYWFLTSRHYDNVASFSLEREHGLERSAVLAPVEVPWLMGAALLGLAMLAARRRFTPELALIGLPLLVCAVFYYSARYRLVAAPVLCGLAALAAVRWRELPCPRPLAVALVLLPVPLLLANAAIGFGSVDFMREDFARSLARHHLLAGDAREAEGSLAAAERHYRSAVVAHGAGARARRRLYNVQAARGDDAAALATLEDLAALRPDDLQTRLALAWLLASSPDESLRRGEAALRHARAALRLSGDSSPDALMALALAQAELGRFDAATSSADRGRALAHERDDAELAGGFEVLRAHLAQRRAVRAPPRPLQLAAGQSAISSR